MDLDADLTAAEVQMMQAMGIPFSFDSTSGKHVSVWGGLCVVCVCVRVCVCACVRACVGVYAWVWVHGCAGAF